MLLIRNADNCVDMDFYKLVLATICSKSGLAAEFRELVETPCSIFFGRYRKVHGSEPRSLIDVFLFYFKTTRKLPNADELMHLSYDKLFSVGIAAVLRELLNTHHMQKEIFSMLRGHMQNKLNDVVWQQLKGDLYEYLYKNIKRDNKFIREDGFFKLLSSTIGFYVQGRKKDLFAVRNQTGINEVDENEYSSSLSCIEELPEEDKRSIDFPGILKAIHRLNTLLFVHSLGNTEKFYFYDILSYYKKPHLNNYYKRLCAVFEDAFGIKGTMFLHLTEKTDLRNTGVKEKYQKFIKLLNIIEPVVRRGLSPDDVGRLVEAIYRHVLNTQSSSSSNLFTVKSVKGGLYSTGTAFTKMSGHETVKEVIEGGMALHHLFTYLTANKLNLFDIESEVFMDPRYLYRFETVEEAIKLFPTIKKLIERPEDQACLGEYTDNQLFLNDNVISLVGMNDSLQSSIPFVDITGTMGDLVKAGAGRKERGSRKVNAVYSVFEDALTRIASDNKSLKEIRFLITLNGKSEKIPLLQFFGNIAKKMDLVSAMEIKFLVERGISADVACIIDDETGYYKTPAHPFMHYCLNDESVAGLVAPFCSNGIEHPEAILEVYRACSFFICLSNLFSDVYMRLCSIIQQFGVLSGVPMGFFDAYTFVSENRLIYSFLSEDDLGAVRQLMQEAGSELFFTSKTTESDVSQTLISVYRIFKSKFKSTLDVLGWIKYQYYSNFADKLGGGYSLKGDEAFFDAAKVAVASEHFINTSAGFEWFAKGCTTTLKGILQRNGELVTSIKGGNKMFLTDRGVWVGKNKLGDFIMEVSTEDDWGV